MTAKRGVGFWLAVGLGSGLFPLVPGTVGTLPLWLAAYIVARIWPPSPEGLIIASIIVSAVGVWAASEAEKILGHDPKAVVIDEWAGMLIALVGVPPTLFAYVVAFVLFRFFDVVKPFPAALVERLPRGWGVVMDDVFAGLYALLTYHLLHGIWPGVI